MTKFRPTSDVGRANLGAAAGPVAVSADTAAALLEALEWAQASDGAFDPCLARLTGMNVHFGKSFDFAKGGEFGNAVLTTGEVRSGFDVVTRNAPLPVRPRRASSPGPSGMRRNWLP